MTGGLQCQLHTVAPVSAVPSYSRGCRAGRRPPRQIPTRISLEQRRVTRHSQSLGSNTDNLVQLSISTYPLIGHRSPSLNAYYTNRHCRNSTVNHGNLVQCHSSKNRKSGLSMLLLNARSARNKTTSISENILDNNSDIVVVTETWFNEFDAANINDLTPPNFKFLGADRDGRKGGGVAILYRDSIKLSKVKSSSFQTFEHMITKTNHYGIVILYRPGTPPFTSIPLFLKEFEDLLDRLAQIPGTFFIVGDFNLHVNVNGAPGVERFLEILNSRNMAQHVHKATHRSGNTLDLIITPDDIDVSNVTSEATEISDHYTVTCTINTLNIHVVDKQHSVQRKFRPFRKLDMTVLTNKLNEALSEELLTSATSDCTTQLQNYCETLKKVLDELAPLKTSKATKRLSSPWYTDEIHLMRQLRKKNESIWRKSGLEVHRMIYIDHRNDVNQAIRAAKCEYYTTLLEKADLKVAFSTVNRLLASPSPQLPDQLGDGQSLCEQFASFFVEKIDAIRAAVDSVPTTHVEQVHAPDLRYTVTTTLNNFRKTSETEVEKIVKRSKSTTCALDPLPTDIVKKTASAHIPALTRLINTSFETGIVPVALKKALVTPILKKPGLDVNTLSNYRPVSNIPFTVKVMEKIAVQRLSEHLTVNGLHEELQSAYKPVHSTETALMRVQHDIANAMDTNQAALLVLLDMSAAFDTIDADILIDTLHTHLGVNGTPLKWCRSFLSDRCFAVKLGDSKSADHKLKYGVPQGSVLGPFLFTVYSAATEAILKKHGIKYHKYADDIQIYLFYRPHVPGDLVCAIYRIQACFKELKQLLTKRKLKLNDCKTESSSASTTWLT